MNDNNADNRSRPARDPEAASRNSELTTIIGHLYRAEMNRVTTWRQRLDETSKWAVTVLAAILVYAFSSSETSHAVLLAGIVVIVIFLGIEARRYQTYEIWRSRLRLMQENLFAQVLDPRGGQERRDWREELSRDYREPAAKIMYLEALQRRLRRVYLPLLLVLAIAWTFRITLVSPETAGRAAAIGEVPGSAVIAGIALLYLSILILTAWPQQRQAKGEISNTNVGQWKDPD